MNEYKKASPYTKKKYAHVLVLARGDLSLHQKINFLSATRRFVVIVVISFIFVMMIIFLDETNYNMKTVSRITSIFLQQTNHKHGNRYNLASFFQYA